MERLAPGEVVPWVKGLRDPDNTGNAADFIPGDQAITSDLRQKRISCSLGKKGGFVSYTRLA
jgi:hypothetical protein